MAFGFELESMLVDFFMYFLFTHLAFGLLPFWQCGCLACSIERLSVDFSPTQRTTLSLSLSLPSSYHCTLVVRTIHTYKRFDYNNKCKFIRSFLYKYDCFINVCYQLESNHRTVKIVTSPFGNCRIKQLVSFHFTFSIFRTPEFSEISYDVFSFLKFSFCISFHFVFFCYYFFLGA